MWYATISADGCNNTVPCSLGGREYLYTSPKLRGPGANWQLIKEPLFTSSFTVMTPYNTAAILRHEFVTADYIGNLTGDPYGGITRVFFNNVIWANMSGTTMYFIGRQSGPGTPFTVIYEDELNTGMVDWGAFTSNPNNNLRGRAGLVATGNGPYRMMRTISIDPNQVARRGRKVAFAWLQPTQVTASQALARDLTLDPLGTGLLQQFVPELQVLRLPGPTFPTTTVFSQQIEVFTQCTISQGSGDTSFGIFVLLSSDGLDFTRLGVSLARDQVFVNAAVGPLVRDPMHPDVISFHAIVDHSIVTLIVNNRTAITSYVTPRDENSNRVEMFGINGNDTTCNTQVWNLRTIYDN